MTHPTSNGVGTPSIGARVPTRFRQVRKTVRLSFSLRLSAHHKAARLRAELVEDPELQERMLATIAEMQAMTDATLSLVRQDTNAEPTRTIDLSALVESICEDLAEIGQKVNRVGGARINYRCRPEGLRRSIRNLIENAVRYAGRAEVRLVSTRAAIEIVVEDEEPGIPLERIEEVFAPFFRLEGSRSRETGGHRPRPVDRPRHRPPARRRHNPLAAPARSEGRPRPADLSMAPLCGQFLRSGVQPAMRARASD